LCSGRDQIASLVHPDGRMTVTDAEEGNDARSRPGPGAEGV
jgi:hypothetical protein